MLFQELDAAKNSQDVPLTSVLVEGGNATQKPKAATQKDINSCFPVLLSSTFVIALGFYAACSSWRAWHSENVTIADRIIFALTENGDGIPVLLNNILLK